ncbi:hypothetical protein CGCSCA5_v004721 [Colletotrichum siamense]|nr:hypothetical protein CGCSCA5_v004721 [Colletotrichum siamense]
MAQSRTHPVYMESIATRCPSRRLEDLQVSSNGPGKYSIILSESTAGCPSHQAGSDWNSHAGKVAIVERSDDDHEGQYRAYDA